jgi:hypothetical protein
MPIDIALVAAAAVGRILVPFFQRGAEKVAADLGDAVSESAAEHATEVAETLWKRVKHKLSRSDSERVIAERFEKDPEKTAPLLESDLMALLQGDPAFADEIAKLLDSGSSDGSGNVIQIFGAGNVVDARYSHVERGFIAASVGSVHNAPSTVPPKPTIPPHRN